MKELDKGIEERVGGGEWRRKVFDSFSKIFSLKF